MRIGLTLLTVLVLAAIASAQQPATPATPAPQQVQKPRQPLSPRGQAEFAFTDGKKIVVDYGRPYMRGRKIMGGLVPYGQVWRTGANAATSLRTQADLELAGVRVPAGEYTMYTIPGEDSWTVIISKQTGQWGTVEPKQDQDVARVKVKPVKLASAIDQFTISLEPQSGTAGVMKLEWENTSVPVEFKEAK